VRRRLGPALAFVASLAACGPDGVTSLLVPQDVPDDVDAELATVWAAFTTVFAGRLACIDDVRVVLVGDVGGGDARYVAASDTIEVEIPTTPGRFRESVAHELAHHVERSCADFAELRTEIHPTLGGGDWASGRTWYETPSERWAEHVAELLVGERVRHVDEVPVSGEVLAAITRWGAA
jgi:hypothetical protein